MPWTLRLDQFRGPTAPVAGNRQLWSLLEEVAQAFMAAGTRGAPFPARFNSNLLLHPIGSPGEFVITDQAGTLLGMKQGDTIVADPASKGLGVGLSLVDAGWKEMPWAPGTAHKLSFDGHGLLTAYHRRVVVGAVAQGLPVPQLVRDDHGV
jgi:hypothetical protein